MEANDQKTMMEQKSAALEKKPSVADGVTSEPLDAADRVVIEREQFPLLASMTAEQLTALERRVRRKVDSRLLPTLLVLYILNYLDRNTIAQAKLGGLQVDLGLTGSEYQTAVSIFYVGYILFQIPSNIWLNKIGKPALYLMTCMAIWGAISACSGAAQSYGGFLACRFLLGIFEAAFFPGCMYTLSTWYKREELGKRMAFFYCGSQLSGAFAGLISAGIVENMDGVRGLEPWRWLFIIEGAMTVFAVPFAYFILPNFPSTTRWLTKEEREMAVWRLHVDSNHAEWTRKEDQITWAAFVMLLQDWKNWILVAINYCTGASLSINTFFPAVLATLGRSRTETLLLTTPPYLLSCITMFSICWSADHFRERFWHMTAPLLTALTGFIVLGATTAFGARYFGAMIIIPGIYVSYNLSVIWQANTIYSPPAKRAGALAMSNSLGNIAGLYTAYLFPDSAAPRYALALGVNAGMIFISILLAAVLRFALARENRLIEKQEQEETVDGRLAHARGFRYVL
ncbi:hypothetical protein VTK73DRAFT_2892 [Phialemonium thermophilum]|uniref:Major facilitator superfamily (MFS) profile domain-containing protein n=1 Tax=Phialemonium thermophilum TaxID=223376 RepID=A0ABR3X204_9PEZI